MYNQLFGILTIISCCIGYFYSWKFQKKGDFRNAILFLMLCGLVLRLYTSTDFYIHLWDERFHALVAKNMINHPFIPTLYDNPILPYDYRNWISNHIWMHKPPLPLWTLAGSMWLFGVNEIALRLPSIIMSTVGIALTFSIGRYVFDKRIGYLAAFFYSLNGLIVVMTSGRNGMDHVDISFLFYIELSIFLSIQFAKRKKIIFNVFTAVTLGAAILSKWLPALIVLPIWLLIVIDSKNFTTKQIITNFLLLITVAAIVFIPWQIYIFNVFPREAGWETTAFMRRVTESFENQGEPFYYYLQMIRINYHDLIYIPLVWSFIRLFQDYKNLKRIALHVWFIVPVVFFSIVITKMPGYILFTSPVLFILTAEFWFWLYDLDKKKYKWLINTLLILLIALPVRYTIEKIRPFHKMDRTPQWTQDLRDLNKKNFVHGVLWNYTRPIEAMYYTNLTAYASIPDETIVADLLQKGYTVIINDEGNVPGKITSMKGVVKVRLAFPDNKF